MNRKIISLDMLICVLLISIIIIVPVLLFVTPAHAVTTTITFLPHSKPIPIFGPLNHTYNLTIGNKSYYPIKYGVPLGKGIVESIKANTTSRSITVIINDDGENTTPGGN